MDQIWAAALRRLVAAEAVRMCVEFLRRRQHTRPVSPATNDRPLATPGQCRVRPWCSGRRLRVAERMSRPRTSWRDSSCRASAPGAPADEPFHGRRELPGTQSAACQQRNAKPRSRVGRCVVLSPMAVTNFRQRPGSPAFQAAGRMRQLPRVSTQVHSAMKSRRGSMAPEVSRDLEPGRRGPCGG